MAHLGVFELFAKILKALEAASIPENEEANTPEKIKRKERLRDRIQATIAGCCWSLCIAHMQNKEKANAVLDGLLSLLAHSTNNSTLYYSGNEFCVVTCPSNYSFD